SPRLIISADSANPAQRWHESCRGYSLSALTQPRESVHRTYFPDRLRCFPPISCRRASQRSFWQLPIRGLIPIDVSAMSLTRAGTARIYVRESQAEYRFPSLSLPL